MNSWSTIGTLSRDKPNFWRNSKNLTAIIAYTGRQDPYHVTNALRFLSLFSGILFHIYPSKNVFLIGRSYSVGCQQKIISVVVCLCVAILVWNHVNRLVRLMRYLRRGHFFTCRWDSAALTVEMKLGPATTYPNAGWLTLSIVPMWVKTDY